MSFCFETDDLYLPNDLLIIEFFYYDDLLICEYTTFLLLGFCSFILLTYEGCSMKDFLAEIPSFDLFIFLILICIGGCL